jgi:hypothetical protein
MRRSKDRIKENVELAKRRWNTLIANRAAERFRMRARL